VNITLKAAIILFVFMMPVKADHGEETWRNANEKVVSVLPKWPGYAQSGIGAPPGTAPEGSGIYISPADSLISTSSAKEHLLSRFILTAAHVITSAETIHIRRHDGSILPARLVVVDIDRDLALLKVDQAAPALTPSLEPLFPGRHVCVIGNSFGLGLSLSCGVVSATGRQKIGFNAIEDFVQTDAAVNPGASGGALITGTGDLIGMVDAIFTKEADIDAGVNFAVSAALIIEALEYWQADGVFDQ
jgi:S1-C subfamily serine protease